MYACLCVCAAAFGMAAFDESAQHILIGHTIWLFCDGFRLHLRMHLPIKSKTIEETIEQNVDPLQTMDPDATREKFYCDICGKYYDKTFQQVHMQMHNGEEKFNCGICNKVFPNEESINLHMSAHQETRVVSWHWLLVARLDCRRRPGLDSNCSRFSGCRSKQRLN